MQINWQQVRRLLVVFVGDIETELTFLQAALQQIRQTSSGTEITLLIQIPPSPPYQGGEQSQSSPLQAGLGESFNRIITHTTTWQDPVKEKELIENLGQFGFEAAIILTTNNESPYPFAYLAYLAGIPIRVGRSREFGGSVLSVISYQLPVTSEKWLVAS